MRARAASGCDLALAKRVRAVTECRSRFLEHMVVTVVMVVELVIILFCGAIRRYMLVSGVVCCAFCKEERRSLLPAAVVLSIFWAGVRGCFPRTNLSVGLKCLFDCVLFGLS